MADNNNIIVQPSVCLTFRSLEDIFKAKVHDALVYDVRNKVNVKVSFDIYGESMLTLWSKFFRIDDINNIDTGYYRDMFRKGQSRTIWKRKYSSVSDVGFLSGEWWTRHHGRFRTVILVKKGETMCALDPGIEVSAHSSVTHSFRATDRAEKEIVEGSIQPHQSFQLIVRFSTTLLRADDTKDIERMYTGQKVQE
tara:strand:+ start:315 stop:899 length:585 start_codon:yes stop_codon:yes gene_type:complete